MKKNILTSGSGLQGVALATDAVRYAEQFRQERVAQYMRDRTDALRRLESEAWKAFCLRWNLAPPYPKGWGNDVALLAVQHKTRIMLVEFSEEEKRYSAQWLTEHFIPLPEGLIYEDGKLSGEVKPPSNFE